MKKTHTLFSVAMFAAVGVAAACGSTTPTSEQPESSTTAAASSAPQQVTTAPPLPMTASAATPALSASVSAPVADAKVWADAKSIPDQAKFMGTVIVPHMKPVFQAFDAKKYDKFGCETCHGPKKQAPKDFLPHLSFKGASFAVAKDKAAVLKFMEEKVVPEMASAMGEPPFDPKTKTGFGCGDCHVIDMK